MVFNEKPLLKLLKKSEFKEINVVLADLQIQLENKQCSEEEIIAVYDSFQCIDSGLGQYFAEWLADDEHSYMSHTALASWLLAQAWEARGGTTSDLISDRGQRGLQFFIERAEFHARYALSLTENPLSAWLVLGYVQNTLGCTMSLEDIKSKHYPDWYQDAIQANAHSFALRKVMLLHLRTEWGGSEEHMLEFIRQQQEDRLLSQGDIQKLWADFHSHVSHYALYFLEDTAQGIERAKAAADLNGLSAGQLFIALTQAKASKDQRALALERYLSAVEQESKVPDLKSNVFWAIYQDPKLVESFIPRIVSYLQRLMSEGQVEAVVEMAVLVMRNRRWEIPDPRLALRSAREMGHKEAAEMLVHLQEVGMGIKANLFDTPEKCADVLKAADLGSDEMSWRVYEFFDDFSEQFNLDSRAKYKYLLCAADAGNNDARFALAQQLRGGYVEVGEDNVLRPVDTPPLQESLDYAKYLLEGIRLMILK